MNEQRTFFHALGGHCIDLWRMAAFDPGVPYSLSKLRQLRAVGRRTNSRMFIETGTYLGNTARRASYLFEKVITIEVEPKIYEKAKPYLDSRPNIECLLGDCNKLLPEVLDREDVSDCVIFLDGHFSGGETGMADMKEPAVHEIESIAQRRNKVNGIVIDDFRMFGRGRDMPSKSELFRAIEHHLPEYVVSVNLDQVLIEKKS